MDSQSPEVILKQTRQAKGIPIESVHEATKIPLDVLKAIEEGYTVRALASPFYRKQFIKMYASFLGIEINASAFVAPPKEEKKPLPTFKKLPPIKEKEFEPKRGITLTKQQKQQIVIVVGALLALFLVTKAVAFIGSKVAQHRANKKETVKVKESKKQVKKKAVADKAKVVKKEEVKKEEAKKEEVKKEEIKKEAPEVEPLEAAVVSLAPVLAPVIAPVKAAAKPAENESRIATPVVMSPESGKLVNLTVRAKKKSWLQVKVDGNTVFQSSLQKGAVENWQADDRIELTGNNILFLEFEVNGKMIGNLSRTEGRARKLIVTKDGLSVKR